MPEAALREVLATTGLDEREAGRVAIVGADPVLRTRFRVGSAGAAAQAAIGIAASALWKLRTGREQTVHVDLRAVAFALRAIYYTALNGTSFHEIQGLDPWFGFYPVRDGRWLRLHTQMPPHRDLALALLGNPIDAAQARAATAKWDGLELEETLHARGGCAALVRTAGEWARHPQSAAVAAQPLVEIRRIGDAPPEPLPAGDRPLSGVRALDLTCVLAGPTCARTLAEHGADVLRIGSRHFPDSAVSELESAIGKRNAEVDLRTNAGVETLRALTRDADVFSQGFRPGSLAARGFSPEAVAQMRPGIVYVELSAWGNRGPWKDRRGFDTVIQSANGMADAEGDGAQPAIIPAPTIDYVTGFLMAFGAMEALRRRATEGGSWHVRASLARTGQWIWERGRLDAARLDGVNGQPQDGEIERLSAEVEAPAGTIRYLRPPLTLSETTPYVTLPPVPLGYHPAAWERM